MRGWLWVAVICGFGTPLWADTPHPVEAGLNACLDRPEGTTTHGMLQCMDAARAGWDLELNRTYAELRSRLEPAAQARLRTAQRQWLAFRDAEIAALEDIQTQAGGTMYQVMVAERVAALTRDRYVQLEASLEILRIAAQ